MKVSARILLGVLLFGCTNNTTFQPGTYSYVQISKLELGYLFLTKSVTNYYIGSELILNKDSSYKYITCGNILTGSWRCLKDSLLLKVTNNRWRIDSLNNFGFNGTWPRIPTKPLEFKIENNYLERIHILKNGKKIIEKLKLNVP
jgi:hypothetical protein